MARGPVDLPLKLFTVPVHFLDGTEGQRRPKEIMLHGCAVVSVKFHWWAVAIFSSGIHVTRSALDSECMGNVCEKMQGRRLFALRKNKFRNRKFDDATEHIRCMNGRKVSYLEICDEICSIMVEILLNSSVG